MNETDEKRYRERMRQTDQDLGWQCNVVQESFNNHLKTGEIPAPYYPMRIAILLRKAKEPGREQRFLAAWCRHFPKGPGAKYGELVKRWRKLKSSKS